MTDTEVERLIREAGNINYQTGRKENRDLQFLLCFMYYSHLKMSDALKVRIDSLSEYDLECYGGIVTIGRDGQSMLYEVPDFFYGKLILSKDDGCPYFIKTKRRALTYAFNKLAREERIEGILTEVYYAGNKFYRDIDNPYDRLYKRELWSDQRRKEIYRFYN